MLKYGFGFLLTLQALYTSSQELYVFTDPASNIPAQAGSAKVSGFYINNNHHYSRPAYRVMPEFMYGLNKKLMIRGAITFANMHTHNFRYESLSLGAKYRFLSNDEVHRHFRMAAFARASVTSAPFEYQETGLMGDKSGVELGVIATQLLNKLALSATVSQVQVIDPSRSHRNVHPPNNYQAMNYSFSSGYLLFPRVYSNYNQPNFNLYFEVLAQQALDVNRGYLDLAPALQVIIASTTKINLGYRFQVAGAMDRMTNSMWQLSAERTFYGLRRKSKK